MGQGLETDDLVHKATLWSKDDGAVADQFGASRVGSPILIDCRFRPKSSLSPNPQSNTVQVVAEVVVDREISLGSILRREDNGKLYEVVGYDEKWAVDGEAARRKVTVASWNGSLPGAAN